MTRLGRRALAVLALVLPAGALLAAHEILDQAYGPTHPASPLPAPPTDTVRWIWSGAVTTDSAEVVAGIATRAPATLDIRATDGSGRRRIAGRSVGPGGVTRFSLRGLRPDTGYRYRLDVGGRPSVVAGGLRTAPAGAEPVSIAFGADASTGSSGTVFDAIAAARPHRFVHLGDAFYADIAEPDRAAYRIAYHLALTAAAQARLYRTVPIAYVWDDHDWGANDSGAESESAPAAHAVYRQRVPHYPLPLGAGRGPIAQAFSVGQVRVILTDLRSQRRGEGGERTLLGARQKLWLKRELLRAASSHAVTIWASSVPWIGPPDPGSDLWAGAAAERREIAEFLAVHGIDRVVIVTGDAHMLAIDDGTNSRYSDAPGIGPPVLNAAPLDRRPEVKPGRYTLGPRAEGGQFGLVTVRRVGGRVCARLSGRDWQGVERMAARRCWRLPAARLRPQPDGEDPGPAAGVRPRQETIGPPLP